MAWIESHQTLREHPKLKRLARRLSISEVQACGHLHFLWWWALDYAPDGDISGFDELDLAIAAAWIAEAEPFVQALKDCGWIDGESHTIHDWHDYGGRLFEQRERNRLAKQRSRQRRSEVTSRDVTMTSRDVTVTSLPSHRLQNSTEQDKTEQDRTENAPTEVDAPGSANAPAPEPAIKAVPKARAHRLPVDFVPEVRQVEYATEALGMTAAQVRLETEKFRDHFAANGKAQVDWQAAWRNWMRRSTEFAPRQVSGSGARTSANPFTALRTQGEATVASFDDAIDVEYAER